MHFARLQTGIDLAELEFVARIADRLRRANVRFRKNAAIGGIPVDLLIETPDGRRVVVEAKRWKTLTSANVSSALNQRNLLQEATGADRVYLVFEGLKRNRPSQGLLTEDGLFNALTFELGMQLAKGADAMFSIEKTLEESPIPEQQPFIFAAMPFLPDFEDVYYLAMGPAAEAVNAVCLRVDQQSFVGDVMQEVKRLVKDSIAVIADVSGANPNVLFEAGLAHAMERKTIQICSTPQKELPFDVRNLRTITYRQGQVYRLKEELTRELKSVLGKIRPSNQGISRSHRPRGRK